MYNNKRDKYKHRWFAEKILQKATGFRAEKVKEMLDSNIEWNVSVKVTIKEGRIISFEAHSIDS